MIDFNKAITTLEFYKITEMLASLAPTKGAKALASTLVPSADIVEVQKRLRETTDAKNMSAANGSPSFGGVVDVTASAERAQKGAMLTTRELLEIASVLRSARSLVDYIKNNKPFETVLDELFERLLPNRFLEDKITRSILSEDMIADEASRDRYFFLRHF